MENLLNFFFLWGGEYYGDFVGQISVWNFKELEKKVYKFSSPPSGTTTHSNLDVPVFESHPVSSSNRGKRGRGSCSQAWFQWCSHLEHQWDIFLAAVISSLVGWFVVVVLGCEVWANEIFLPPNQPKLINPHLRQHEKPLFFLGQKTQPKNLTRKKNIKNQAANTIFGVFFGGGDRKWLNMLNAEIWLYGFWPSLLALG